MGQKTHPRGFRLALTKNWRSVWYAPKKTYKDLLLEDLKIRDFLKKKSCCQGSAEFIIRRMSDKIEIVIRTSRPGLVIGKKGVEIELLKQQLKKATGKEIWIEVEEIKRPDLEPQLVAESIGAQVSKRIAWRRALKKAMQNAMDSGAAGVKIQISGRIGGAEIARSEWYKEGKIPLHTLRTPIRYAEVRAETTYGTLGIKVWINVGEMAGGR